MLSVRASRPRRSVSLGVLIWIVSLSMGLIQVAVAQSEGYTPEQEVEEITSYGSRFLHSYRVEMVRAEVKYYDAYNALNDDDEFDVICKTSSGNSAKSRIKKRICKGQFEWDAFSENDRDRFAMGFMPMLNHADITRKRGIVLDRMEKLAEENPEFREALFELTRISREFEAEKRKRCTGRLICASGEDPSDE
jgi:hypothetical protein